VKVGRGVDLLPGLTGPFDFVFIDADKASNPDYFREALRLSRPGTVIVVDNVVRAGAVLKAGGDANVEGIRRMNVLIAAEPRVSATAVQTVGSKGWDGFCLVRVI
jgi:predicted O-methyltransferase YrrM